jgi:hypothetical protein
MACGGAPFVCAVAMKSRRGETVITMADLDPETLRWVAEEFSEDSRRADRLLGLSVRAKVLRGRARWLRNIATRAERAAREGKAARVGETDRQIDLWSQEPFI